jgi:hypothetical protein
VLASVSDWQLVFGLMLLAIALFAPDGILGVLLRGRDSVLARRDRARARGHEQVAAISEEPEPAVLER